MQKLIVPVYLNNRVVFDLIAMLKGGLTTVTSVTQTASASSTSEKEISSKLGIGQVLSNLLKVDLSASTSKSDSDSDQHQETKDRVHTPGSLLFQLIEQMTEEKAISKSNITSSAPGTFVEFECQLNKNPLVETLDNLIQFANVISNHHHQQPAARTRKRNRTQKPPNPLGIDEQTSNNLQAMLDLLNSGDTIDLVGHEAHSTFSAVITLEPAYLNDPLMSDLIHGHFKVLGIVTKSISDESDSINLLRKTPLSFFPEDVIASLLEAFNAK